MYTEPVRRAAMVQARDHDMATLSGPINLVADIKGQEQVGFKMYMPIYKNGTPHDTLVSRRINLLGWVYALFRANDLMGGILGEHVTDIDIEIFEGNKPSENMLMYDSDHVRRAFGKEKPRFQASQQLEIDSLIRRSILFAKSHPDIVMPYVRQFAQEMDESVMKSHIDLYVNDFSIDLGQKGTQSIEALR